MRRFGNIEEKFAWLESSRTLIQPIIYDGTSTWGKGADKGPSALFEAAENMELYDIETDSEAYKHGIHILPELKDFDSPEDMVETVYSTTKDLLKHDKFLTFIGGEHSVSIGVLRALTEKYPDLSVLHIDAHADLRASYEGTPFNHACALHEASRKTNLVQVGIRSMDISEKEYLNPEKCYFAHDIFGSKDWQLKVISQLSGPVYITIDLDGLDPSIMSSTGTPEPGGLGWYELLQFMRKVFKNHNVIGFDLVELAPNPGFPAPDFLAAKLYYKLLSYRFENE